MQTTVKNPKLSALSCWMMLCYSLWGCVASTPGYSVEKEPPSLQGRTSREEPSRSQSEEALEPGTAHTTPDGLTVCDLAHGTPGEDQENATPGEVVEETKAVLDEDSEDSISVHQMGEMTFIVDKPTQDGASNAVPKQSAENRLDIGAAGHRRRSSSKRRRRSSHVTRGRVTTTGQKKLEIHADSEPSVSA